MNCPNCGEENPARFRLCGYCGTALAAPAAPREVRRTVTIVFTDLKGSTDLAERLDSETLREVITRYFEVMSAELEEHGGTISKYIGDAVMAVFGMPTLHEDDALRGVRAAAGMQRALARLNDELEHRWGVRLENRTGVNTGEIVVGDETSSAQLVIGDPVNTAARLEQAAPTNEILIGELTYRLVRDHVDVEELEPLELKGKSEPVAAWKLLGVRATALPRDDGARPMVGRDTEMDRLCELFRTVVDQGSLRTVSVIGDAGVGKSRLIREFLSTVEDEAYVVHGRCLPYGRGITFWPLVEIAREAAEIDDDDPPDRAIGKLLGLLGDQEVVDRIASATGLVAETVPIAEIFWAFRRFVEILAERQPVVAVFDDLHWAEQTLLELIEHLSGAGVAAPVLLLSSARNELLEEHPDWSSGDREERVVLGPLGDAQSAEIVESLLGRAGLTAGILHRVTSAAEGNPLFVEQLVSMLVEEGTIREIEGDWRLADEAGDVHIPPTIRALLGARLGRLATDERGVAESASVIGLVFEQGAVRWLTPGPVQTEVPSHLATLDRKQLIDATGDPEPQEDPSFRFHHVLIRDAAYHGLLKRARAILHERYVDFADARNADVDRALEFEEILGYHLEQAHRYLAELGPLDDHGIELGIRAAERFTGAARRAYGRGDMPATASLFQRAAANRNEGDPARPVLLAEAGEALTQAGELKQADEVLEQARAEAQALHDDSLAATVTLGLIYLRYLTGSDSSEQRVIAQVRSAMEVLEAAGDERGLSRAWRILTNVHFAACRYLDATEAAEAMVDHARRAGDRPLEIRLLPALATCAQLGPTPVPEAIAIVQRVLGELDDDRKSEAYTVRALANLEAMRGRFDEARDLYRRSRATLVELGWHYDAALTSAIASGPVELIAGDPVAAEAELRRDHAALSAMGERNYISTTAAFLAEALYRQSRDDEAFRMTEESEQIAAEDDVTTQYLWRTVRAKLIARRGDHAAAEAMSRDAIRIIEVAQDPDSQGYAYIDLAEVLRAAERHDEAIVAAAESAARFDLKGNEASAARARRLLADIEADRASGPSTG